MTIDHAMVLQQDLADNYVAASGSSPVPSGVLGAFREGLEHFQAGDPGAALVAFSRSVMLAPECAEAHIFLGLANALTSNIYPALDHLERAVELQPGSFAAHFTLAQLNFKLRIPQKGYDASRQALRCATTIEHRTMLTQLLKEERARERNGIARPSFTKPWFENTWFQKPWFEALRFKHRARGPVLVVAGSGLAAAIITLIIHVR
jgi:tetratricopeptide (TPR) repeat protein